MQGASRPPRKQILAGMSTLEPGGFNSAEEKERSKDWDTEWPRGADGRKSWVFPLRPVIVKDELHGAKKSLLFPCP